MPPVDRGGCWGSQSAARARATAACRPRNTSPATCLPPHNSCQCLTCLGQLPALECSLVRIGTAVLDCLLELMLQAAGVIDDKPQHAFARACLHLVWACVAWVGGGGGAAGGRDPGMGGVIAGRAHLWPVSCTAAKPMAAPAQPAGAAAPPGDAGARAADSGIHPPRLSSPLAGSGAPLQHQTAPIQLGSMQTRPQGAIRRLAAQTRTSSVGPGSQNGEFV